MTWNDDRHIAGGACYACVRQYGTLLVLQYGSKGMAWAQSVGGGIWFDAGNAIKTESV
jgi:hypothetical protein